MADIDDVKRALVRADVRAVAKRTQLPEQVVMTLVANNGWSVAQAERDINKAMLDVSDSIKRGCENQLFGGGYGGGKVASLAEFEVRLQQRYVAAIERPRGVVLTCVS